MLAENLAMAGAAFAVGFKAKDKDTKAEANAAVLSACLGISEQLCMELTYLEKHRSMHLLLVVQSVELLPDYLVLSFILSHLQVL